MTLNTSNLKTRSLTAFIFLLVMLQGFFYNKYSFFILLSIINVGCLVEFQKIMGKIYSPYSEISTTHKFGVLLLGIGILMYSIEANSLAFSQQISTLGFAIVAISAALIPLVDFVFSKTKNLKNLCISTLGIVYISFSWALFLKLSQIITTNTIDNLVWRNKLVILPIFAIGCMWINDTMAYLVGSLIGKTPLSSISPKKTWEGTIGGILLCGVFMGLVMNQIDTSFLYNKGFVFWAAIAIVASIFGTLGDLVESKLKRLANIKDSGNFMPGHGGFLDRFDSILLATPIVYFLLNWCL
jgi:phosphatidate cytidylyltransferase